MAIVQAEYKAAKEAFVSGSVGGSVTKINSVCATALTSYALWAAILHSPRFRSVKARNDRASSAGPDAMSPVLEFFVLVVPLLLSLTLFANHSGSLNALLVALVALVSFAPSSSRSHRVTLPCSSPTSPSFSPAYPYSSSSSSTPTSNLATPPMPRVDPFSRPFVTVYRAHMMLMTILCILAVDFPIFPREFSKTETWGTSLMDLGVGSVVFSMGIVAALPLLRTRERMTLVALQSIRRSVTRNAPVLALGFVRVLMVKSAEYPEHVSEYGVHWNFFFTLALLPVLGTLLDCFLSPLVDHAWMAVIITAVHELVLDRTQLTHWTLTSDRTTLLTQNREGLVSLPGYLSIYLLGISTGLYILPPDPYFHARQQQQTQRVRQHRPRTPEQDRQAESRLRKSWKPNPGKLAIVLSSYAVLWSVAYAVLSWAGFACSRRLANMLYVAWITAFNTMFLLGYLLVYLSYRPTSASSSTTSPNAKIHKSHTTGIRSLHPSSSTSSLSSSYSSSSSSFSVSISSSSASPTSSSPTSGRAPVPLKKLHASSGDDFSNASPSSPPPPPTTFDSRMAPGIFTAINQNGLVVFLVGNLLTGLVNVTVQTMYVGDVGAVVILMVYSATVIGIAWRLRGRRLKL